jgi:hypothetical protein
MKLQTFKNSYYQMSIKPTNAPANAPKIGDAVYLPELAVWGEIVGFYDENKQLITQVRAMVNGKPTLIEVTALIVQLANAARDAVTLWGKIKTAAKSLCQKLGLCKPKPVRAPLSLLQAIADAERELARLAEIGEQGTTKGVNLAHAIAELRGFLPQR